MSTIDQNNCPPLDDGVLSTPISITNPPGLSAISYRVGTHTQFKQNMLARLGDVDLPGLQGLTTRQENDFTTALIDSWAMVADVLTFYQERIANESYKRTATESFSLRELSRTVNYQLQPGVAANTYLAFTMEDTPGAPESSIIDVGNKIQSLPNPGEELQIFETVESIEARPKWNAMTTPQTQFVPALYQETNTLLLQSDSPHLQAGDLLLFVGKIAGETKQQLRRIQKAAIKVDTKQVQLLLEPLPAPTTTSSVSSSATVINEQKSYQNAFTESFLPLDDTTVSRYHLRDEFQQKDLEALALIQGWDIDTLQKRLAQTTQKPLLSALAPDPSWHELSNPQIFALRTHAALFGNVVPDWKLLPPVAQKPFLEAYQKQTQKDFSGDDWPFVPTNTVIELDRLYPLVLRNFWCAVYWPDEKEPVIATISQITEASIARFASTNRVTEITLTTSQKKAPASMRDIRRTALFLQSDELFLAQLPDTTPITGQDIIVNGRYDGLQVGRRLIVAGIRSDLQGIESREVVLLHEATILENSNQTRLTLEAPGLLYSYLPGSVRVNANVAQATQGESIVNEILGSGDGSQAYQHFTLRQSPLTYVQAETPTGSLSTLQILVDGTPWQEVPTLFQQGSLDHVFTTSINDDQTVTIQFGDGKTTGARLPTGEDNVQASYRKGIGQQALVDADQLSLLMTHPLGVRGVSNPFPAMGAVDPDTLDDARREADSVVLTMDRVISRRDYETCARSLSGVAKVQASVIWLYNRKRVVVTIAGNPTPDAPCGVKIMPESALYAKIERKLRQASDPSLPFLLQSYRIALFRLAIQFKVVSTVPQDQVVRTIEQQVRQRFTFEKQQFAQDVALREVLTVIQSINGVAGVKVKAFYRIDAPPQATDPAPLQDAELLAAPFRVGEDGQMELAELLLLDPNYPFDQLEVVDEL